MKDDARFDGTCRSHEKEAWEKAAALEGRKLANWIKRVCNREAEKIIRESESEREQK